MNIPSEETRAVSNKIKDDIPDDCKIGPNNLWGEVSLILHQLQNEQQQLRAQNETLNMMLQTRKCQSCERECPSRRIYPMCSVPRGKAIIINNQKFDDPETFPFRLGASVDSENLEQLFSQLSFEVIKYENLRRNDTMKIMIDLADTVGGKDSPCDMLIGQY